MHLHEAVKIDAIAVSGDSGTPTRRASLGERLFAQRQEFKFLILALKIDQEAIGN
jgi:hypothetical protein